MIRSSEHKKTYFNPEKDLEQSGFAKSKPKMDEFKGTIYSTDDIERDLQKLYDVERKHVRAIGEKAAQRLELVVGRNTEMNNWLGETAFTYQTHDFDDVLHHTDMVVEWHDDKLGVVRLGIDVTTADPRTKKGRDVLEEKHAITDRKITEGRLHEVKYFKGTDAQDKEFLGRIMIPRVVINISAQRVNEYWESYIGLKEEIYNLKDAVARGGIGSEQSKERLSEAKKELAEYDEGLNISYIIAYQIVESLLDQVDKLKKNHAPQHVIDRTEHALICSQSVLREKEETIIKKYPLTPRVNGVLDVSKVR
jgi:hypothetical protein